MTHNYLFAKSFFIAFLFSLFAGNAWAQSLEPITIDARVEGETIYLKNLGEWNAVANLYNGTDDASPIIIGSKRYNSATEFVAEINTICIQGYEGLFNVSEGIIPIEELQSGHTITMDPYCCIIGTYYDDVTEAGWGLLVKTNEGIIEGIRIKQFNVYLQSETSLDGVSLGLIAQNNSGTIKNCEVIDSKLEFTCESTCKLYVGAIAGEIGEESEGISNCLVKDFEISLSGSEQPTIYAAQIVGKDYNKAVKNNCVFITNAQCLNTTDKKQLYPFTAATMVQGDGTTVNYGDIDESNRAFILCTISSDMNIDAGDGRIVRYDATATENTGQVVNQTGLEAAIKTFCNQEYCDFDVIKYGDYVSGSAPWNIFYNYLELDDNNGFYMPMVRDLYAPHKNKDGRYVIADISEIRAMANMMLNNTNGDKMYFQFGDEESSISENVLVDLSRFKLDVPSGCTIDGCGGKYLEFNPENPERHYYLPVNPDFSAVFGEIKGTVKRFVIEVTETGNNIAIEDTENSVSGFLAIKNSGTIESCGIIAEQITIPNLEDWSNTVNLSVGGLVGVNEGTIQNVTCSACFIPDGVLHFSFNLGGIAGTNRGTISDVVFTDLSIAQQAADGSGLIEGSNGTFNSGLFVGENINGGTLENAFVGLNNDQVSDWNIGFLKKFLKSKDGSVVYTEIGSLEESELQALPADYKSNVGFYLHSRSDKDDITLLYDAVIFDEWDEEEYGPKPDIADRYLLYKYSEIPQSTATQVLTNFSNPSKWQRLRYEEVIGDLSLSMDDRDDDAITVRQEPDGTYSIASVSVYDAEQFIQIGQNPSSYRKANISLEKDVDMKEVAVAGKPIPAACLAPEGSDFEGSVDGNNHTISGVRVNAYASETALVPTPKEGAPEQMEELLVAQTEGIFGNLGEAAEVKNIEIHALVKVSFDRDAVAGKKKIHVPLLAKKNKNRIKNVVLKAIIDTDTENLDEDATAQYTLVGDNSNESTDPEGQPVIENVVAYLPNSQLLYKSYSLLESEWNNNSSYYYSSITFEKAYFYWCNLANFTEARKDEIKMYGSLLLLRQLSDDDIVIPTFESFADWYMGLEGKPLESMTRIINANDLTDDEDIIELVCNFVLWYYANNDQQIARRAADKTVWATYNSSETSGNHVAVIATQNLCKSPGKGRTRKVCTAPAGGGNKDAELIMGGVCLNPDSKNEPKTEKYCSLETFPTEGAYWLNHEGESLTGNYGKMFSKGALYPILATNKSKPLVKLEYIVDGETKEQAEAHGLKFVSYANEGSNVQLSFTDRPAGIRVNGTLLDASAYSADHVSFTVPQTPEGVGKVSVLIGFDHIPTALEEIDATEPAEATGISVQGNTLTISAVEGQQIEVTDLRGVRIAAVKAVGTQTRITIPNRGIYVVKVGTQATKVAIK